MTSAEYKKLSYKLILIGDGSVGKTSIRKRYMGQNFVKEHLQTLGADFAAKTIKYEDKQIILQIWDVAGQRRFETIRDKYYQNTHGILLMFDITNRHSFDNIPTWLQEFLKNKGEGIVSIVIIGNKADLENENQDSVLDDEVEVYLQQLIPWGESVGLNFYPKYMKTSALTGENVKEAFTEIIKLMDQNTLQ
jgi:small GTP-binding protein